MIIAVAFVVVTLVPVVIPVIIAVAFAVVTLVPVVIPVIIAVVTLVPVVIPTAGSQMIVPEPVTVMAVITVAHEVLGVVVAVMVASIEATGGGAARPGTRSRAARVAVATPTAAATVRTAGPSSPAATGCGGVAASSSAAASASGAHTGRTTRSRGRRDDGMQRDRLRRCTAADTTEDGARHDLGARWRDRRR